MNRLGLAAICFGVGLMLMSRDFAWPSPAPFGGPNLAPIFTAAADRVAARLHVTKFAETCYGLASYIKADGPPMGPGKLKTPFDVEDLRFLSMAAAAKQVGLPSGFGAVYPGLNQAMGDYFGRCFPGEPAAELDEQGRAAWAAAFEASGRAARYAEAQL